MPNIFNEDISKGPVTFGTSRFYSKKTIQRTYDYLVRFDKSGSFSGNHSGKPLEFYHAVSIELPTYEFKKEEYKIGNFIKTFPVLDHNGFEFSIIFEEDDIGTISTLIEFLQSRIINGDGYYRSNRSTVIDNLWVGVHRSDGVNVYEYVFENVYFLKASTVTYSYNTSEKVEYTITFNADHFTKVYRTAGDVDTMDYEASKD